VSALSSGKLRRRGERDLEEGGKLSKVLLLDTLLRVLGRPGK